MVCGRGLGNRRLSHLGEKMTSIETNSPVLPFLGTLENGEPFEYLLVSLDSVSAKIALMQWFLNRTQLQAGDKIDLYLPHVLSDTYKVRGNISGIVSPIKPSEE